MGSRRGRGAHAPSAASMPISPVRHPSLRAWGPPYTARQRDEYSLAELRPLTAVPCSSPPDTGLDQHVPGGLPGDLGAEGANTQQRQEPDSGEGAGGTGKGTGAAAAEGVKKLFSGLGDSKVGVRVGRGSRGAACPQAHGTENACEWCRVLVVRRSCVHMW